MHITNVTPPGEVVGSPLGVNVGLIGVREAREVKTPLSVGRGIAKGRRSENRKNKPILAMLLRFMGYSRGKFKACGAWHDSICGGRGG